MTTETEAAVPMGTIVIIGTAMSFVSNYFFGPTFSFGVATGILIMTAFIGWDDWRKEQI